MLRSLKGLLGASVNAIDGDIGKLDDFYFDDQKWKIRYFIVRADDWLTGRHVLISPFAFGKPDWTASAISVNLTKELVRSSPETDLAKPLTREQEKELHQYYEWVPYWNAPGAPGFTPAAIGLDPETFHDPDASVEPHLYSMKSVMGYHIDAQDGEVELKKANNQTQPAVPAAWSVEPCL